MLSVVFGYALMLADTGQAERECPFVADGFISRIGEWRIDTKALRAAMNTGLERSAVFKSLGYPSRSTRKASRITYEWRQFHYSEHFSMECSGDAKTQWGFGEYAIAITFSTNDLLTKDCQGAFRTGLADRFPKFGVDFDEFQWRWNCAEFAARIENNRLPLPEINE